MKMIAPAPGALFMGFAGAWRSNASDILFDAVEYVRCCLGNLSNRLGIRGGILFGVVWKR